MQTFSAPGTAFEPVGEQCPICADGYPDPMCGHYEHDGLCNHPDHCPATGEKHSFSSDFAHYQRTGETGLFICECGARPSKEWLDNFDPTPE